jgi:twitching motility protein PilI
VRLAALTERQGGLAGGSKENSWAGIGFKSTDTNYILPIGEVVKIVDLPVITPVFGVQPWVKGVATVQGEVVSIVDFNEFLGKPSVTLGAGINQQKLLVVKQADFTVGFLVESMLGVLYFTVTQFSKINTLEVFDLGQRFCCGSFSKDKKTYQVLLTSLLLQDYRFTHPQLVGAVV